MYDDVLTRNENEELAVRVVSATEQSPVVNPNDVYTRDTDGNLCIRTTGSGGSGDQHNLGYYATPEALEEAYPTANAGDYAIVGSTDSVWVWDDDNSEWLDTGAKETSTYLPFPAGWHTTSSYTTKQFCDSIASDDTAIVGKAYLGELAVNDLPASMVNAEVVVEIMSGTTSQNKVIKLTCTSGNQEPYMWIYTYWNGGSNVSGWVGFQPELISGTNIKTINNQSLLGGGNINIESGIPQYTTMPTASASNAGEICQFAGVQPEVPASATISQTVGSGLSNLAVNVETFETQESTSGNYIFTVQTTSGSIGYTTTVGNVTFSSSYDSWANFMFDFCGFSTITDDILNGYFECTEIDGEAWWALHIGSNGWIVTSSVLQSYNITVAGTPEVGYTVYYSAEKGEEIWSLSGNVVNISDYGITYSGIPDNGDTLTVVYTEGVRGYDTGYFYKNVSTQGQGSATISQTAGIPDYIYCETTVGNTTINPFPSSAYFFSNDHNLNLVSGTLTFVKTSTEDIWDVTYNDSSAGTGTISTTQSSLQLEAFSVVGTPEEGDTIICTYSIGNMFSLAVDVETFETQEHTTGNYVFTYDGADWKYNNETVNLADYGISYEGEPVNNDALTVAYTEGAFIYDWERIDVQPAGATGIVWASTVDLPSGSWDTTPYVKVTGGLPEGEYEFYVQTKNHTGNSYVPLSTITFRIVLKVRQNYGYSALIYPIIDGEYYASKKLRSQNYDSTLFVSGSDVYIQLSADLFSSNIPSNSGASLAVEDCFKISAIKNLDTLEEIIPEVSFTYPTSFDSVNNINFYCQNIDYIPTINNYWNASSLGFADCEYIEIANARLDNSQVFEVYITLSAGKENQFLGRIQYISPKDVRITVPIATGAFTGVTFNKNNQDYTVVLKLNSPTPRTGNLSVETGFLGATNSISAALNFYDSTTSFDLTPLIIDEVGCEITQRNLGSVWQYTKDTNANYTKGYFYEATGTPVLVPTSATCEESSTSTGTTITCDDASGFVTWLSNLTNIPVADVESLIAEGYNEFNYNPESSYYWWWNWGYSGNSSAFGSFFTFSPTLQSDIVFIMNMIPSHIGIQNPAWVQYNTQPSVTTPSTMPTLTVAGWSSNTQTVTVNGVTTTNNVLVAPAPASSADWTSAGVICTAQGTDSLTFTCTQTPSNDITVNVCILG